MHHEPATSRDLSLDLLRAGAVACVAIGHWIVVVPTFGGGGFDGSNALGDVPLTEPLSWLFQVMPLFFVVGGAAHTHAWSRARARGERAAGWVTGRLARLLRPAVLLLASLAVVVAALGGLDVAPTVREQVGWVTTFPLWFLAVYLGVVVLAPAMVEADGRWGWRVPGALAAVTLAVDVARFADHDTPLRWLNMAAVFLACHALGSRWVAGALDRTTASALAAAGATFLALGVAGPYSLAMVGVPGDPLANNAPPTACLLALGLVQAGLAARHRDRLATWATHPRAIPLVVTLNLRAMSTFLWHMPALVLAAVVLLPLGAPDGGEPGTARWWVVRLAWLPVYAAALTALVAAVGRAERAGPTRRLPLGAVVAAAAIAATGAAHVAVGGVADAGGPAGLAAPALLAVALPAALLLRRSPASTAERGRAASDRPPSGVVSS